MTEIVKNKHLKTTKEALDGASVKITVALDWSEVLKHRTSVIKDLQKKVNLPGFRKGHIPESVLIKQVGNAHMLEEMAEEAIESIYPDILHVENVRPLAFPKIDITKLEENSPLEFTVTVDIFPEVKLADYKKLAIKENLKKVETIEVTEKEVDKAIEMIQKQRAGHNDDVDEEIDDSFAQSLGAKDLADLKEKVKTELLNEKERKQSEKRRIAILEAISAESIIDVPNTLVEDELSRMKGQMSDNLAQMNLTFDNYLKELKKTQEEMFIEWRPDAEKRVRFELTLSNIAEKENIAPSEEDTEKEAKHLMEHYKDITIEQAFSYATNQLRKQKTFEYLESLK